MVSNTSGDISTLEAAEIIRSLKDEFQIAGIALYPGVAYRHLLVWENGPEEVASIPPHDVLDENMAPYLNHASVNPIVNLITRSWSILKEHPVNRAREEKGLRAANSIWLWGQGKAPRLPSFLERYGLHGGVISAVDLLKGIGIYAGLTPIYVEGAQKGDTLIVDIKEIKTNSEEFETKEGKKINISTIEITLKKE